MENQSDLEAAKADNETVEKFIKIEDAKNKQFIKLIAVIFAGIAFLMFVGSIMYAVINGDDLTGLAKLGDFLKDAIEAIKTLQTL